MHLFVTMLWAAIIAPFPILPRPPRKYHRAIADLGIILNDNRLFKNINCNPLDAPKLLLRLCDHDDGLPTAGFNSVSAFDRPDVILLAPTITRNS